MQRREWNALMFGKQLSAGRTIRRYTAALTGFRPRSYIWAPSSSGISSRKSSAGKPRPRNEARAHLMAVEKHAKRDWGGRWVHAA